MKTFQEILAETSIIKQETRLPSHISKREVSRPSGRMNNLLNIARKLDVALIALDSALTSLELEASKEKNSFYVRSIREVKDAINTLGVIQLVVS